jgi:hypothetical protein
MRICSVEGCDKKYLAKGFCRYHYSKNHRLSETKICSIADCKNVVLVKGVCNTHYIRIKKNKPVETKSCYELTPKERLLKFVKINEETNCWDWIGAKNRKGYGSLHFGGKTRIAHRMSYELYVGEIPSGLLVCHHCDQPECINPEHLFLGTDLDNSNDKFLKGRQRFLVGEDNVTSKLTTFEIVEIKNMLKEGIGLTVIAKKYNTSRSNIDSIKKHKSWRHIN